MRAKNILKYFVIAAITIVLVLAILKNISLENTWQSLKQIGFGTLLVCFGLHFLVFVFRSLPMKMLLAQIPFFPLLNAHLIHNFYLQIIPASLGELTLPELLKEHISRTKTLSGLLVARLYSIAIVGLIFLVSILLIFNNSPFLDLEYKKIFTYLMLGLLVLIALSVIAYKAKKHNVLLSQLKNKVLRMYNEAKDVVIRSILPWTLIMITGSNMLYLLFMALFYKVIMARIGVDLGVIPILFIMTIQVAILLLPIKSLGGFGTTEGSWMLGMMALGIDRSVALETGLIIHIVTLLSAFIFFVIGLTIRSISAQRRLSGAASINSKSKLWEETHGEH
ncbi:MAG: lysylphosphatidylglycerol synthase transmembrane domain-containing protein [Desulfitobacteriaceae bacterium]|jgi:uncharacterized protein (TIRG00374 family)|nr:lysylphosphatidylglycerol synthase transmembrane domain-containing protein [Desulfitobacteriaceae bacterium]